MDFQQNLMNLLNIPPPLKKKNNKRLKIEEKATRDEHEIELCPWAGEAEEAPSAHLAAQHNQSFMLCRHQPPAAATTNQYTPNTITKLHDSIAV